MKVGFIGQGYGIPSESTNKLFEGHELDDEEITTVGQAIVASLADSSFHTAHFLTAFVTRSGVQEVADAYDKVDGVDDLRFLLEWTRRQQMSKGSKSF